MYIITSSSRQRGLRFSSTNSSSSHFVIKKNESNGVVKVRFNRPSTLNALTGEMGSEFKELMAKLSKDNSIRCLILSGAGKAFSAGGDLKFLRDRTTTSPQRNVEVMREFYSKFLSIRSLPFPTIAAINGHAVGAGLCLALACDIRLASETAKMGLNFTKIGLTPGMAGSHTLPLLIGQQAASRMILTGDLISAKEALKLGVVLDIFPGSQNGTDDDASPLMIAANDLATRISSSSPVAVRATVKTLRMRVDDGLERALQREADTQAHCYAAEDMVEGLVKLVGE